MTIQSQHILWTLLTSDSSLELFYVLLGVNIKLIPMKPTSICATAFLLATTASLPAQNLDPSGAWKLSNFELSYSTGPNNTEWASSLLDTLDVTVNPNGTFTAPDGSGNWFFSDNSIYLVTDEVLPAAITRELDTVVFAESDGNPFVNVSINAGNRLPDADFVRADVSGTWQILRQTSISFSDSFFGTTGYNGVFHAHETLVLNPNGTFTLTMVSNTDPGDDDDESFSGTWSVVGRGVRLSAGGETLDITNLSAGLDTFIDFRTEMFTQGSNTNSDREVSFGIKQPATLSAADLVGRWGFTGMSIDVEDDLSPTYLQEFRGAFFESGDVSLLADGTGIYRRSRTNDPTLDPVEHFTWEVVGVRLIVTASDGDVLSFHVSAGKDFAVSLNIEDRPGGSTDTYDVFTLCRLPVAPGFAAVSPRFDFSGTPRLSIPTTEGLYYQLQRSIDLSEWVNVGEPVEGDGTEKFREDPSAPSGSVLYRFVVVAAPE